MAACNNFSGWWQIAYQIQRYNLLGIADWTLPEYQEPICSYAVISLYLHGGDNISIQSRSTHFRLMFAFYIPWKQQKGDKIGTLARHKIRDTAFANIHFYSSWGDSSHFNDWKSDISYNKIRKSFEK